MKKSMLIGILCLVAGVATGLAVLSFSLVNHNDLMVGCLIFTPYAVLWTVLAILPSERTGSVRRKREQIYEPYTEEAIRERLAP